MSDSRIDWAHYNVAPTIAHSRSRSRAALELRRADGSWFVPLSNALLADDRLEVVVAHDDIREVLGGRITVAGAGSAAAHHAGGTASVLRDHKQMAWWILNITIVLIAAIAISRRLS